MTQVQRVFSQAMEHHKGGRYAQAAELYQWVLGQEPRHGDALRLLGLIAHQHGQHEAAVGLLRDAVEVNAGIAEYWNDLGLALLGVGKVDEGVAAFEAALRLRGDFAEARYNLGNAWKGQGKLEAAVGAYRAAIGVSPGFAKAHNNLGNALQGLGRLAEGIAAYRRAVELRPGDVESRVNLANGLQAAGELEEAIGIYEAVVRERPEHVRAWDNLGMALQGRGRLGEAAAAHRMAIGLEPERGEAHFNLGNVLQRQRQFSEAVGAYRRAIFLNSWHAEALNNLGNALKELGKLEEAEGALREALRLRPEFAEAHNNLGNVYKARDLPDEAAGEYRAAVAIMPDYAEAWNNLGGALKDQGLMGEAMECFRRAAALKPGVVEFANNVVYAMHFDPANGEAEIAAELAAWNRAFAVPAAGLIQGHENDRTADRALRVGWISPDFRRHPIGRFLLPLFERHGEEFICYSDVRVEDELTGALRQRAHKWVPTGDLSDEEVAALVRQDRIDVLMDITMHMQGSRLGVFARKAAPVQVTYLAYSSSTGMEAMDYRMTDARLETGGRFAEEPLQLKSYWCYAAEEGAPAVGRLPAMKGEGVTFGCLNNFCKASEGALEVWSRILLAVPKSRLMLHAPAGSARERVRRFMGERGVAAERCGFIDLLPFDRYLQTYHEMDIGLDTFPYAGGTTTCDALYMGVPVVTLAGRTGVGRSGVSLLSQLDMGRCVAATMEEYVQIAVGLAGDLEGLAALRRGLRERMQNSRLMDGGAFARNFEAVLRGAWRRWCEKPSG